MNKTQQEVCDKFRVTGYFYVPKDRNGEAIKEPNGKKYTCRSYLNLKRKGLTNLACKPDLMVIMMNPGGSRPKNGNCDGRKETRAIPDNTQGQITKVMDCAGLNYARVLNLSDLRDTGSKEFCNFLGSSESQSFPHSIFDSSRRGELRVLFKKNVPVILAWGVNDALDNLAKSALTFVKSVADGRYVGVKNKGGRYCHPARKGMKWVNAIVSSLEAKSLTKSALQDP